MAGAADSVPRAGDTDGDGGRGAAFDVEVFVTGGGLTSGVETLATGGGVVGIVHATRMRKMPITNGVRLWGCIVGPPST